tara:strand:- start:1288 stop:1500 length:213 start_codon:yes stop_codon:yes gene_type:complete
MINKKTKHPLYYGVLFHYNTYTQRWNCFQRDTFNDYFNGVDKDRFGRGETEKHAFQDFLEKNVQKKPYET